MKQTRPKIDPDLVPFIQDYANKHCNGRLTKAVDWLLRDALDYYENTGVVKYHLKQVGHLKIKKETKSEH